jgi:hypothetical protein
MAKQSKPQKDMNVSKSAESSESAVPTMPPGLEELSAQLATAGRPTLEPPSGGVLSVGLEAGASAWASQKVTGLWTINQDKNSWVAVTNVGWIKLSIASDTGITALMMLAASAKETQTAFNYRKEADNMIHEIYVW